MGLEEKFYPQDGSYLTKFDNAMIRAMGRVGEAYQQMTGREYTELLAPLYTAAGLSCIAGTIPFNPFGLLLGNRFIREYAANPPAHSPLEEEIQCEATGQPKYAGKLSRASLLFVNVSYTIAKAVRDPSVLQDQRLLDRAAEITLPFFIYGLLAFALTDYMAKSNIPKPPKESLPRRMINSLQSLVSVPTPTTNQ